MGSVFVLKLVGGLPDLISLAVHQQIEGLKSQAYT